MPPSAQHATPPFAADRALWPALLLPLIALCAVLPLLLHGVSCGHDYGFHLQSWIEAGDQIRHGHLFPHWAFTPAYNAGEPRFVFYPPLSWLLGALLTLALPAGAVVVVYTWLALAAAGTGMYALARDYTSTRAALLASAVYIANPYVLFTAFERTAFAELLAAAWMPLLIRAALAARPSALRIAVPLALLWLTNAPAAVMGTYALVLITVTRLVLRKRSASSSQTSGFRDLARDLLLPAAGGLALGLALASFYLVPAAWERRYVQIAMAIIPNMRVEDNFLFGHTGYGPHDQVLHTASLIALALLGLTTVALVPVLLRQFTHPAKRRADASATLICNAVPVSLCVLAALIAVLLWHITLPIWHIVPELAFLQFPWRLLSVLGCVFGLATALALQPVRLRLPLAIILTLALPTAASLLAIQPFRQGCEAQDTLAARVALFRTHHGVGATDEYTPVTADNDQLRWDDPAWWLTTNPNAPGPHTVPNPASTIEDYDQPPPLEQTVSGQAPMHLRLHVAQPEALVLNLRDYPAWRATVNGTEPAHLQRDDGLLALPLPAGDDTVDIHWHTLPDMWLGDAITLCALGIAGWLGARSRKINPEHGPDPAT